MKKIISIILCFLLMLVANTAVFAETSAEEQPIASQVTTTEELNNGVTVVKTVTTYVSKARSGRSGSTSQNYYYGGQLIATVYLNATFNYTDSVAYATSSSGSASTASGWAYGGQSTWCSGNTANLSATVSGSINIPVSLSLSCSPNGTLS